MKVLQFTIPVAKEKSLIIQEDVLPFFYTHFHRHVEMQITWIIKGEGTLIAGNNMHRFQSNDVFIIGANQAHVFKNDPEYFDKKQNRQIHSITLFFNVNGSVSSLLDMPEMSSVKDFIKISSNGLQASLQFKTVISDYILKIKINKGGFRIASFIELMQFMANIKDWKSLSDDPIQEPISEHDGLRMNDIYQYTIANYSENIPIEKIASIAFLTPPAFCRYFKKHTMKTYVNFLNEVRINEACKQLLSGKFKSLSSLGYENGFNNAVTFNRVFRKLKGKTPGEYHREYDKNIESNTNY